MIPSAFTIDVECGINISMRDYFNIELPPTERVVSNTRVILQLLQQHQAKATFFVLGDVAAHFPGLVKEIAADGHEVGVHSYAHYQLFRLSEQAAKEDTRKAKDTIENIIGSQVYGFRAPAFSLMPSTAWALPMLAQLGFVYDSSIMPAKTGAYGWPGFSKDIVEVQLQGGQSIIEFPLSVSSVLGREIPVCGGGYLKWFPLWYTEKCFREVNNKRPVNVYLHPYEVDTVRYPDYFYKEINKLPLLRRLKAKSFPINKKTVPVKLDHLLRHHRFETMYNIITARKSQLNRISFENLLSASEA